MANDYFQFKQFTIHQQRCAMKVGTDGTLLGAWAQVPIKSARILDIGTGTGLIALMMAQRFPEATVLGIDIDGEAVNQAQENVVLSPQNVLDFEYKEGFDAIVSNPPYFVDALTCPDQQRTIARHTISLTYEGLMKSAYRLLKPDGMFSLVIPSECRSTLEAEACLAGFFLSRVTQLYIEEGIIEEYPNVRSSWYQQLTQDFYIR